MFDARDQAEQAPSRTPIGLCVCTYRRNEPLQRLLVSLRAASDHSGERLDVGVVVVDDNPDGRARSVVERFKESFPLGISYVFSGQQNIARARNLAVTEAMRIAEWVGMVDDDVVVPPDWLDRLLDVSERTGADAVTGPMHIVFPEGSPPWLSAQPFGEIGAFNSSCETPVETCATSNTLLRSGWLRDHPEIRFDEDLGTLGGEDVVFFRRATASGLRAHYSSAVAVQQLEPLERSTLAYQLRRALWMGNSSSVTNLRLQLASRQRLVGRGARRCIRAGDRMMRRAIRGQTPQVRYAVAGIAEGLGMMLGGVGIVVKHR